MIQKVKMTSAYLKNSLLPEKYEYPYYQSKNLLNTLHKSLHKSIK